MIHRYYFSCIKKDILNILFPFVYLIPLFLLLCVNIIKSVGTDYQKYTFLNNSDFNCVSTEASVYGFTKMSYIQLYGKYSEELSLPKSPYYGSNTTAELYLCTAEDTLKQSYFTEKNLLRGNLPEEELIMSGEDTENSETVQNSENSETAGNTDKEIYPICITYDIAIKLDSDVGDNIDMPVSKGENEYEYIRFNITGILLPDGMDKNCHYSCALVTEEMLNNMGASDTRKHVDFSKDDISTKSIDELYISLDSMKEEAIAAFKQSAVPLASVIVIIAVLSVVTNWLMKRKIDTDMTVLNKMGLSRFKISLICFLRSYTVTFISALVCVCAVALIYLPYVAKQYYDIIFLGGMFVFIAGLSLVTCFISSFITCVMSRKAL